MKWLLRLLGVGHSELPEWATATSPEPDAGPPLAPKSAGEDTQSLRVAAILASSTDIINSPESANFIIAALRDVPFAKGLDVRKHGTLMSKDELRQKGMRANTICSVEFYAILTAEGALDPVLSAQKFVSRLGSLTAAHRQIINYHQYGITMVEVIPNNMAAGPCSSCSALAGRPIPVDEAPMGPLPDCPHPDQCSIRTKAILQFD